MVFVLSLYKVRTVDIPEFAAAFAPMGIWPRVANQLPGYVHADLMIRSDSPRMLLLHQFWETAEHFQVARRSEPYRNLAGLLGTIATGHLDIGVFGFRPGITRAQIARQTDSARW